MLARCIPIFRSMPGSSGSVFVTAPDCRPKAAVSLRALCLVRGVAVRALRVRSLDTKFMHYGNHGRAWVPMPDCWVHRTLPGRADA